MTTRRRTRRRRTRRRGRTRKRTRRMRRRTTTTTTTTRRRRRTTRRRIRRTRRRRRRRTSARAKMAMAMGTVTAEMTTSTGRTLSQRRLKALSLAPKGCSESGRVCWLQYFVPQRLPTEAKASSVAPSR